MAELVQLYRLAGIIPCMQQEGFGIHSWSYTLPCLTHSMVPAYL